ncbi:MAG: MarR family transcriptional regulator [Ruminococcus sp.]|uniref:MarR family winged helix-turn-helix transcriptional regulator n=1 Tax=Ruminococcus sp. TaxID=41978 RepID=UPI0026012318|nr:MarR family transcriptional regulator [Ruminococcus sp.]MCR5600287.1 MarR family transcriptional regulator [Ruminococcus sp.]
MGRYDALKLENQLCFPLYACAREVIKKYTPLLKDLDLTYTQYIAMMVLWEKKSVSVKELGRLLFLDSGTLTPVLKSLEAKGLVHRSRSTEDERVLIVQLTENGAALKENAVCVPEKLGSCIPLEADEAKELYRLLYKLLGNDK